MFYNDSETIFGKSYPDWVVKWWQSWGYADWRRNRGDVFMVPAKMQNDDIKERSFKINKDKPILLSVINWIGPDLKEAKEEIDIVAKERLDVSLDGTQIGQDSSRILTPFFRLRGKDYVSDGYWLFFKPNVLEEGRHEISSYGSCRSGKIQIAMNYHLSIS